MSVAARKLAQEREAEKRVECPVCLGSGHDKQQTWPPGKRGEDGQPESSFAECEGCHGFGLVSREEKSEMEVSEALARAKRALAGDSNDEEHDALFELVEALEKR